MYTCVCRGLEYSIHNNSCNITNHGLTYKWVCSRRRYCTRPVLLTVCLNSLVVAAALTVARVCCSRRLQQGGDACRTKPHMSVTYRTYDIGLRKHNRQQLYLYACLLPIVPSSAIGVPPLRRNSPQFDVDLKLHRTEAWSLKGRSLPAGDSVHMDEPVTLGWVLLSGTIRCLSWWLLWLGTVALGWKHKNSRVGAQGWILYKLIVVVIVTIAVKYSVYLAYVDSFNRLGMHATATDINYQLFLLAADVANSAFLVGASSLS